ncbi:MAG: flavin reductase family protein [Bacteroidetes bacterium]|nr:MAG: flavin reductase family protein [Bacteroidota bacterium]
MSFKTINTKDATTREIQSVLTTAVAPRPIAFASTVDADGNPNLSPFSFFNAFGANPPILIFSPARRGKGNTTKHTFDNVKEVPEVVINMVNFEMVEQMSLSSADFPKGVNEFEKAGFTPIPSESIRPFRVKESPVQFECSVQQVIETGTEGGAGNLVICHVNKIHINEDVLNSDGGLNSELLDLVGRMGGNDYIRSSKAIFTIPKPSINIGIGIDALPEFIRTSSYLTGRELARLGSLERLPEEKDMRHYSDRSAPEDIAFGQASSMIEENNSWEALCYLMSLDKK